MTDINEAKNQLTAWSDQINTVKKIGNTPLYKQWLINEKNFQIKKNAYKKKKAEAKKILDDYNHQMNRELVLEDFFKYAKAQLYIYAQTH